MNTRGFLYWLRMLGIEMLFAIMAMVVFSALFVILSLIIHGRINW